ncbi:nucleotidyl transferase AbiEii/AbiGii toxin family protein [Massilia sp. TSP1-1-2]
MVQKTRPLNSVIHIILKALHDIAATHQASYFLIGAMARDIVMTHVFGIEADRATRDVDFAIALEDWSQFDIIRQAFIHSGDFQSLTATTHRLYYRPGAHQTAYPLDLIPFGKIASANTIAWPPDMAVVMNVTGYADALEHAIKVDVGTGLIVNVVSIPALAILKILAWNDRGRGDNKDAQDLLYLLRNYHAAGNSNRLFDDASSILESCDFAIDLAGAALLGHDARLFMEESTRRSVLAVLNDPVKLDRLTVQMSRSLKIDIAIPASFIHQFQRGVNLAQP